MTIYLLFVGKPRDTHANAMAAEYIKRAGRFLPCRMAEIDPRRYDPFERHAGARVMMLDPGGKAEDSRGFQQWVERTRLEARDLVLVVGGHDGLPAEWRERAEVLWSLTPLTLPHELARVLAAEQVYRALAAMHRHPYGR